jgi:hypothetical protein
MRHLIAHFNTLFLGMILGMTFLAIVDLPISHWQQKDSAHGLTIGYEIFVSNDQTTVLLVVGTTTHLLRLPASLGAHLSNQDYRSSPSVASVSWVTPAIHQQVRR